MDVSGTIIGDILGKLASFPLEVMMKIFPYLGIIITLLIIIFCVCCLLSLLVFLMSCTASDPIIKQRDKKRALKLFLIPLVALIVTVVFYFISGFIWILGSAS